MSTYDRAKSEYFRTKVTTASQEELHLMLYDGAIRFVEDARQAMTEKRLEDAHTALVRAQNIILEFSSSLNHEVNPELCGKMASLYNFIYRRLVEGNLNHDASALDDALRILEYQRETWSMLMTKLTQELKADSAAKAESSENENAVPSLSISA